MKTKLTIFMLFPLMWGMAQTPHLVIPKGHTAGVTSSCYSKNNMYVLTGSRDFTARLWDRAGHEIQSYRLENEVQAVAFSPTGDSLLTGSTDGKVVMWKISGEKLLTISGHKNYINAVAFSPDGKKILSGSSDATAKLWDLKGTPKGSFPHAKSVTSVAFTSDGNSILTGSEDKTAILWNLNGKKIQTFIGHQGAVTQARISNDNTRILTSSADRSAILYDKKGKILQQLRHTDKVMACDFSPNSNVFATASQEGVLKIWNGDGSKLNSYKAQDWGLSSMSFSPDGRYLLSSCEDRVVRLTDLKGNTIHDFKGHAQIVNSVYISKDGNSILSGCGDKTVKLWDIVNHTYRIIKGHKDVISSVAFSPDGQSILTGSEDKTAILWNLDGKIKHSFSLAGKVSTVGFSPDGKLIIAGCYNGCAKIWDTSGADLKMFKQTEKITNAVFSQNGKMIATGSDDRMVYIYNLDGKKLKTIEVGSQINSLVFSPDNNSIITGNFNGLTQVWDLNTNQNTQTLGDPGEEILSVAISNDGQTIGTGSNDGIFKLWNLSNSTPKVLTKHTSRVNSVNFSSDSKMVATGSLDGTIRLWDCSSSKELLTLVSLDSTDWVVTNNDGLFDASPGAMQLMYYQVGMDVVDLNQLKDRYFEPGLLGSTLGITQTDRKATQSLNTVELAPEVDATIADETINIILKEKSGGIGKLSLLINNKEVLEDANPDHKLNLTIKLDSYRKFFLDTNIISLIAYNKKGWLKSQAFDLTYLASLGKGTDANGNTNQPVVFKGRFHLYGLVVGTSHYKVDKMSLRFPDHDAKAIASALQAAGSRLFDDRVHIKLLSTETNNPESIPSKANIEKAFKDIASKATAGDILVIYFSGHGATYGNAENSQFHYLTKDLESEELSEAEIQKNHTVSSNDLTKWVTAIPAKKQVIIFDACHSGKVVESFEAIGARDLSPSQIRALDRMKDRTGMFVLTGSAADKVSFEASQYGQGLLTYSLLQGMSGFALSENKWVDVAKLFEYSRDKVPELAKGINKIQIPILGYPKGGGSFDIGIVDDKVKIPVAQAKPVFIRSMIQDENTFSDPVNLNAALSNYFDANTAKGVDSDIVYVDVNKYDNAYSIKGLYNVKDKIINLRAKLYKGADEKGPIILQGNTASLQEFADKIMEAASGLMK